MLMNMGQRDEPPAEFGLDCQPLLRPRLPGKAENLSSKGIERTLSLILVTQVRL
jgi:hypothetical protein